MPPDPDNSLLTGPQTKATSVPLWEAKQASEAHRVEMVAVPLMPNYAQRELAKENEHFLKGINPNNCQDILPIPSPPAPRSMEGMGQRRPLMPFFPSKSAAPLQDMTNGGSFLVNIKMNVGSKVKTNRKRRSFCHVPPPLVDGRKVPAENPIPEIPRASAPPLQERLLSDGCEDDRGGRVNRQKKRSQRRETILLKGSPKRIRASSSSPQQRQALEGSDRMERSEKPSIRRRTLRLKPSPKLMYPPPTDRMVLKRVDEGRKRVDQCKKPLIRRQSLLFPCVSTGICTIPPETFSAGGNRGTEIVRTTMRPKDDRQVDLGTVPNLDELRGLVRGYCSLRADPQKRTKCAESIKAKTGYSLVPVDSGRQTFFNSDVLREKRKALSDEVGPSLQHIENEKVAQAKQASLWTGCTVEKTRGGTYQYRDASGNRVSAHEYKARYGVMIARKKHEKAASFRLLLQQLDQSFSERSDSNTVAMLQNSDRINKNDISRFLPPTPASSQSKNDDMDCEDTDILFETATPQSNHGDTCALLESTPRRPQQTSLFPQPPVRPVDAANEEFLPNNVMVNIGRNRAEGKPRGDDRSKCSRQGRAAPEPPEVPEEPEKQVSLLPIPSPEEESDDPEIIACQTMLWQSIDAALGIYSAEVLAIQARREQQGKSDFQNKL